jgi:hypothetical protein
MGIKLKGGSNLIFCLIFFKVGVKHQSINHIFFTSGGELLRVKLKEEKKNFKNPRHQEFINTLNVH